MALRFRNITATPGDPVSEWGTEGILTAIDRGSLQHWRRIARAVDADPFGPVATRLSEAVDMAEDVGAAAALRRRLSAAQDHAARALVADRLNEYCTRYGRSAAAFAHAIGTSAPRMSTYLRGTVVPSAAMLIKAEQCAAAAEQAHATTPSDDHPVAQR